MPIEVKIPEVGESITEVQIGEWLKAEGDEVGTDESLAVIESEKTNFELPSPATGKLARILHQAGETVKVGAAIAQIEPGGPAEPQPKPKTPPTPPKSERPAPPSKERMLAQPKAPTPRVPQPPEHPAESPATEPEPPSASDEDFIPFPEVNTAAESGDLSSAAAAPPSPPRVERAREMRPFARRPRGSTPAPEISAHTASAHAAQPAQPAPPIAADREEEVVPMSMLRRTVARRLLEAQRTMAMLTTFNEVDLAAVQSLRQQHQQAFQQRYGIKLGLMSFFVKAAIAALKEFPQLNALVRGDDIIYHNYFDIGVAIATPQGLVVPVLLNAERLSFADIENAVADFARRAKERQLKPEELECGTFTITNGGVFGSLLSTPLINPPQSGILGLHAIQDRPIARGGSVVIRPMMYLALTYDHRIVDGREAVLFLRRIKEVIEDPARMLIEA